MDRDAIGRMFLNMESSLLTAKAAAVLLAAKGRHVFARGLIEFSNICRRNCLYCGLCAQNNRIRRYCLTGDEILAAARQAAASGADTIVLQAGEGAVEPEWLAGVVSQIVSQLGLPVTLSVGECSEAAYAMWREAGASRYLLRHETSDASLYARLHPGYSLADRIACLKTLRSLGYATGSGFMVGLPGQTVASLIDDICLCQQLQVAMVGIGPFIPQADTPLGASPPGSVDMTLRLISCLRLALPDVNLPATTALASLAEQGQLWGLKAGANVLMPNFTPAGKDSDYRIYDAKSHVGLQNAIDAIEACGRAHALRHS